MLISFVREISFLGISDLYEARVFLVAPCESVGAARSVLDEHCAGIARRVLIR